LNSTDIEEYVLLRLPPKFADPIREAMSTNTLKERLEINMHGSIKENG
jgi:hypothetical protein